MRGQGRRSRQIALLLAAAAATTLAAAGQRQQVQQQDEDFAKAVREWTTKPEFLSPLVDHLPVVKGVPSPKDVLGHHVGAPGKLTYYGEALKYYRALSAATPRVKVVTIGTTDEGREIVIVFVSSEETIRDLETYRQRLARLADPRGLSEAEAQATIAAAKPIYHVMGGLHSGETGAPEMLMELAYRVAVEDSPVIEAIRDNVILTITPAAEPDGRDRYVDWYYAYKVDEKGETDSFGGPPYWGKYVFHDNNRDINYSQKSMRAILQWYLDWHPPILHDLHESVPFLYTFSGQAPQNPTLDPIVFGEAPWFANFEMAQMTKYGMPGVWTHAFMDYWSPGYLGSMAPNHNGLLRMYEVFGNGGANTMKRKVDGADGGGGGGGRTSREWYRPFPPYKEVEWSIRNNVNYGQTGVLSALQLTAAFPREVLDNFYRKSRNAVESGRKDPPFGFVIPAGQRDMTRVAFLVNVLRLQGIEVGRARAEVKLDDGTFPAGSFIVKRDQPYGRLAKILLEKQVFPDPGLRTYDDSGWTMGLHTRTEVKPVVDKAILDVPVDPVKTFEPRGTVSGVARPAAWAIVANGSANLVTLRCALRDVKIEAAERAFEVDAREFPAGSLIVPASAAAEVASTLKAAVEGLGLEAVGLASMPDVPRHQVDLPRLAMFSTWGSTQEVGWVRYAFDQYKVPYDLVYKERIRQGSLRQAYDVILVPSQAGSGKRLVYDIEPKSRPLAYRKTERTPHLGMYGESDDVTGGMGLAGVVEIQKFLDEGGVLITLGGASYFPADFGLARRLEASRPSSSFYAPGPIVEAEVLRPEHPIFYGYDSKTVSVRYSNGPLLRLPEQDKGQVLMQFKGGDQAVLSGLMRGADEVRNRPAVVDIPAGRGRLIVFATNPCYRWQNLGEFSMLFNAIMHWNDGRQ
ncbi:MAG: M14 family zinc carboxypeptidase [Vicinamibacterales bacterium]